MYEEQKLKITIYKDMLKQALIKKNQYPKKETIQKLIDQIDLRYSIFDHKTVQPNTELDINQLNIELFSLYKDLTILYEYLFDIESKEYIKIQSYVNGYLASLEETAERCEQINAIKTATTTLGDTVYFNSSGFNPKFDNNIITIPIGPLMFSAKSLISCHINGSGFNQSNVLFNFYRDNDLIKTISPYSVNNSTFTSGGELKINTYKYELDNSSISKNIFMIPDVIADDRYLYEAYSGKDKIRIIDDSIHLKDSFNGSAIDLRPNSSVKFFICNGTYINMDFAKELKSKNFTSYNTTNLPDIAEFNFMTGNDLNSFTFTTDGTIYAEKVDVNVLDNQLYASNIINSTDILVYETIPVQDDIYTDIQVKILDADYSKFHIDSIAIKQLDKLKTRNIY